MQATELFIPITRPGRKPLLACNAEPRLHEAVEALASKVGVSKAEMIRRLITVGLKVAAEQAR